MTLFDRLESPAVAGILEGLNPEQTAAVTHGEGPLLIVAGAGTGKTEVITRRIAWLMATGRARPDEILALTFTDKAAAQMEARVDALVPMGMFGATIATFHAFGDGLVRDHGIELGLTAPLRVDGAAEILVFLREHLFELGLERYRPVGRPDHHLRSLVALFNRAQDEDVSPAEYRAFADALAAAARDDVTRDRAESEGEKARAYERYDALLLQHGRMDFGHQLALALRLLRERPWIARTQRERWRWVLIDEFQDTNHVQFELVKQLCGPGANLTVVGDDDQSIYRFRGAKVENLRGFVEAYPGARHVLLRRNYRSGQAILDTAYRLIQHNNPDRLEIALGLDKRLIAEGSAAGEVVAFRHDTFADEADHVAGEIAAAIAAGARAPRDVAVLARNHGYLEPVAQALHARGVPFHRASTRGLYARPEVQLALNALRVLAAPDDGAPLHFLLDDPLFGADPVDLARMGQTARRRNRPLRLVIEQAIADPGSIAEGAEATLAPATLDAVERFLALHPRLAALAARRPTTEVLYAFVTESGLLDRLVHAEDAESLERLGNLNKLFTIVTRVSASLEVDRVASFVRHLDLLIEAGDDPSAAEVELERDAVQLLTVHNAKGLEFPVVYVVQVSESRFPGWERAEPMPLPAELMRGGARDDDSMREERRLFYVACTRARERLVLTSAASYGGRISRKPSRFILEALGATQGTRGGVAPSAADAIRRHAPAAPSVPAAPRAPSPDGALTLSHYQVRAYLECPLRYKYGHVLHVPVLPGAALQYGRAIHRALEVWFGHRLQGLPIEIDDVMTALDQAWRDDGFHSAEHERLSHEAARADVAAYVERAARGPARTLAVEQRFELRRGAVQVTGRFDRIDETADGIVIVDYKSSVVDDAEAAMDRAREDAKTGQLGLYAFAHRETRGALPARGELHFIGSRLTGAVTFTHAHADAAAERIDRAAAGIRAGEFPAQPSVRTCGSCDFSRFCLHSVTRSTS